MNERTLLIAAVGGVLVMGGLFFGWKWYSGGQPAFRGRAIPVQGLPEEVVKSWETAFQEALEKKEVLEAIVEASGYVEKLGIPADEAVDHLGKAVKVSFKRAKGSIEVGLVGQRRDDESLKEIAQVLYTEAEKEVLVIAPSFQEYLDAVLKQREDSGASK